MGWLKEEYHVSDNTLTGSVKMRQKLCRWSQEVEGLDSRHVALSLDSVANSPTCITGSMLGLTTNELL